MSFEICVQIVGIIHWGVFESIRNVAHYGDSHHEHVEHPSSLLTKQEVPISELCKSYRAISDLEEVLCATIVYSIR